MSTRISTLCLLAAACFTVGVLVGERHRPESEKTEIKEPTVEVVYDTIKVIEPIANSVNPVRTEIHYLPIPQFQKDSSYVAVEDSVAVEVPIIQREYEDSTYHAWISGYKPKLDSICVFPRTEIITKHELITVKQHKKFGLGVMAGYGMTPHGLKPYIGVGLSYNFISF